MVSFAWPAQNRSEVRFEPARANNPTRKEYRAFRNVTRPKMISNFDDGISFYNLSFTL